MGATSLSQVLAPAVICGAMLLSGCGDQGTEPAALPVEYALVTIRGASLPLEIRDPRASDDLAIVRRGWIEVHPAHTVSRPGASWPRSGRLTVHTMSQVVRLGPDGVRDVVADGQSAVSYSFERDGARLVVFRADGDLQAEAPFWLEIRGPLLVMQSEHEALSGWHFVR